MVLRLRGGIGPHCLIHLNKNEQLIYNNSTFLTSSVQIPDGAKYSIKNILTKELNTFVCKVGGSGVGGVKVALIAFIIFVIILIIILIIILVVRRIRRRSQKSLLHNEEIEMNTSIVSTS